MVTKLSEPAQANFNRRRANRRGKPKNTEQNTEHFFQTNFSGIFKDLENA